MKYFGIKELVCPHVYEKWGESSWQFLDKRLLETLDWLREKLGKPIVVNNWANGGQYSQRGLRCNCCILCIEQTDLRKVYLSAHCFGQAADFGVVGMKAEEVREWIINHADELPYPIRLERDVTWVHLDVRNCSYEKVELFG